MEDILTEATAYYKDTLEKIDNESRDLETRIKMGDLADADEIEQWSKNWMDKTIPLHNFVQQAMQGGNEAEVEEIRDYEAEVKEQIKEMEDDLNELYQFCPSIEN